MLLCLPLLQATLFVFAVAFSMTEASIVPEFVDQPFPNGYAIEDGVVYIDSRNEAVKFSKKPSPTVSPSRNASENTERRIHIKTDFDARKEHVSPENIQRRLIFETDQQSCLSPPEMLSIGALDSGNLLSVTEDQLPTTYISSKGKELDISSCHTLIKEQPSMSVPAYVQVTEEPENILHSKEKCHNAMSLVCQERKALIEDDIRDKLEGGAGHNLIEDIVVNNSSHGTSRRQHSIIQSSFPEETVLIVKRNSYEKRLSSEKKQHLQEFENSDCEMCCNDVLDSKDKSNCTSDNPYAKLSSSKQNYVMESNGRIEDLETALHPKATESALPDTVKKSSIELDDIALVENRIKVRNGDIAQEDIEVENMYLPDRVSFGSSQSLPESRSTIQVSQEKSTSIEQLTSTLDTQNLNIDNVDCNSKPNLVRSRLMESMMSLKLDDCTQSENSALSRCTEYDSKPDAVKSTSIEQLTSTLDTQNLNIDKVDCNSKPNHVRPRPMESMMSLTLDDCTQSENPVLWRCTEYDSKPDAVNAVDGSTHEDWISRVRDAAEETRIDKRIMEIRKKNEEMLRRLEEVENDRTNSGTYGKSCRIIQEGIRNTFSQTSIAANSEGARNDSSGCNDTSNYGFAARTRGRVRFRSTERENSSELGWRRHADSRREFLDKDAMKRITREEQRVRNILISEAELQEMYCVDNARIEVTHSEKTEEQMWKVRAQRRQATRGKQKSFSFVNERKNSRVSMTGKEEESYDEWKSERNKIEAERLKRSKKAEGTWKREWDREKVWNETMEEWVTNG